MSRASKTLAAHAMTPTRPTAVTAGKHWRPALRAVIYVRVSRDRSGELRSPREQIAAGLRTCEREGWSVVAVLNDGSVSGSEAKRSQRTDWDEVRAMMARGEFDVLVAWSSSRSARDVAEGIGTLEDMRGSGVLYHYNGRTWDASNEDDLTRMQHDVIDDAAKIRVTRRDVKRALLDNADAGLAHGRVPFGYTRLDDKGNKLPRGTQREHPTEGPVIKQAAAMLLEGHSDASVVRWLDEVHPLPQRYAKPNLEDWPEYPEGRPWGRPGWVGYLLKQMLVNPTYAGKRRHPESGVLVDAAWPALWPYEQHERLVAMYDEPWRKQHRNTPARRHHLLSGILRCGGKLEGGDECGYPLYAGQARGRLTYRCKHGHVTIDRTGTDAFVTDVLLTGIAKGYAKIDQGPSPEAVDLASQIAAHRVNAEATALAIDNTPDPATKGVLAASVARINATIVELESALRHEGSKRKARPDAALTIAAATDPRAAWDDPRMTDEQRAAVIRDQLAITVLPTIVRGGAPFDANRVVVKWLGDTDEAAA